MKSNFPFKFKIALWLAIFLFSLLCQGQNANAQEIYQVVDHVLQYSKSGINQKNTYLYDLQGNITTITLSKWEDGNWKDSTISISIFNSNNNEISKLNKTWKNNNLEQNYRYTYSYDYNYKLDNYLYEIFSDNKWEKNQRGTYSYDLKGNNLSFLIEVWQNDQWVNSTLSKYTYNSEINLEKISIDVWINGEWKTFGKQTYSYDSSRKITSFITEQYQGWQWVNSAKNTFIYDSNGHIYIHQLELWENNSWQYLSRVRYSYNQNGLCDSGVNEILQAGNWIKAENPGNFNFNDNQSRNFQFKANKIEVVYKNFVGLEEPKETQATISPNPATEYITVEVPNIEPLQEIELYNIFGECVLSVETGLRPVSTKIDVSALPPGVYFVRVGNEKPMKFMVVR
jgi:hypothetical protein